MSTEEDLPRAHVELDDREVPIGKLPFASSAQSVYSNHTQVLLTPWDFTLRFGTLEVGGKEIKVNEHARVIMSPPHTKAFAKLLARQVTAYEERYGEILDVTAKGALEIDVPGE